VHILDGIEVVLSGAAGFSLSDPLDCTAYGVRAGDGIVLFDCGAGRHEKRLLERLAMLHSPVTHVFLTHAHADHSGGCALIKRETGALVHAGVATAAIVEAADERAMCLDVARRAGIYPVDFTFTACPVDVRLQDRAKVRIADLEIEAVATPGHSADHVSFLIQRHASRSLICGDALFCGGKVVLQDTWDCSVIDTCATIRRLAELRFESLLPGHGIVAISNGMEHVAAAIRRVARLLVPELAR
jgi:glyoxylase-like metal-dependent hydrolase (beta-lactamase superfamily II)